MAKEQDSNPITFILIDEEMRLAKRLVTLERRDDGGSVDLWCREVIRQYLHEFRVMPQAWGASPSERKR